MLRNHPLVKYSMILTKEVANRDKTELVYNRQDLWATGSNTQLNFVQHIHTL